MQRKAFTLIELLVVIAIIAILAAILFPVFAQAKAAAKKSVGLSNLKQQATALKLYQGDADDVYPVPDTAAVGTVDAIAFRYLGRSTIQNVPHATYHNAYSLMAVMQPYIKNRDLFGDPSDPAVQTTFADNVVSNKRPQSYSFKFGLIVGFAPFVQADGRARGTYSDSSFKEPANTVVYHEQLPFSDYKLIARPDMTDDPGPLNGKGWAPDMPMTFSFADGHAKRLAVDKAVWKTTRYPGYDLNWPRRGITDGIMSQDGWARQIAGEPDLG